VCGDATYGARIRFFLDPSERLNHEAESFEIQLDGVSWRLAPFGNSPENEHPRKLNEADHLVLTARGFSSEESAQEHGSRAKAALSLCGAILRIGIDVGRDSSDFVPTDYWKEQVRQNTGKQLHNDLHGLTIYPEQPPAILVHGSVTPTVARCFERFEKSLVRAHTTAAQTPRLQLALELYARSHFETSVRTRFLSLINAVEAVSVQQERSKEAGALVDELAKLVQGAEVALDDREAMLGTIARMKVESIGQACRRVVKCRVGGATYGKKEAAQFFRRCYDIRSDLLHEGDVPDSNHVLRGLLGELDRLVADLLVAEAGLPSAEPADPRTQDPR
jgi:hypothetical protein